MDFTISTALDLHEVEKGRVITVEEHFLDASFIIGCILEKTVPNKEFIVLVLHHHSFGHYQGIATKLGLNLKELRDAGKLLVLDVMELVGSKDIVDKEDGWLAKILENVFWQTQKFVKEVPPLNHTTVVLEHPGNIGLAYEDWPLVLNYVKLFQGLASINTSLVYLTKQMSTEKPLQVLCATMQHCSDLTVTVRGLQTGSAHDISGSLRVRRKDADHEDLKRQDEFHYQLLDKSIRLFAPGTVQFR